MIFKIALPVPVPKTFDYLPAEGTEVGPDYLGRRVKVAFGPRFLTGVVAELHKTSDAPLDKLKRVASVLDAEPVLSESMLKLGTWLSHRTVCSLGEALDALLPPEMISKNPMTDPQHVPFEDAFPSVSYQDSGFVLTHDQTAAEEKIHAAVYSRSPGHRNPILLRGVSAAGKTEVYLSAIKDVLDQGKTALFLAPEIGLVSQLGHVVEKRFGAQHVAVWHSGKTVKERRDLWWKIKRGEVSVVVGARSGALLPLPNIGVIVVDEEHDTAWKEDRKPRFHVRDVAIERGRLEDALVIFGSATPSLEIIQAAKENRVTLIELNERAVPASAPAIRLIDMKAEKYKGIVSVPLEKAIQERLQKKEQVVLFINRKGFFRYLKCPSCEWVARCPNCDVALLSHKKPAARLTCSTCGYAGDAPVKCPLCGHKKIFSGGVGTERVLDEIEKKFPWAHAARWDSDSVKKKGDMEKVLRDFESGAVDILVGTQIVAQGFNFPKVTLVGVIDADTSLFLPDFRAAERTFQLITQVAGRAGRELVTGEVLIQTRHATHSALVKAAHLDDDGFSDEELKHRRDLNYPPFSHMVEIVAASKDSAKAEKDIKAFVDWVSGLPLNSLIGILGPSSRKKKGSVRWVALLKVPVDSFPQFLDAISIFRQKNYNRFQIDVDCR